MSINNIFIQSFVGVATYLIAFISLGLIYISKREYILSFFVIVIVTVALGLINLKLMSIPIYLIPAMLIFIKTKMLLKSVLLHAFVCLLIVFNSSLVGLLLLSIVKIEIVPFTKEYYMMTLFILVSLYSLCKVVRILIYSFKDVLRSVFSSKYLWLIFTLIISTLAIFYFNINWGSEDNPLYLTHLNATVFIVYILILMIVFYFFIYFINKESDIKLKQEQLNNISEYTKSLECFYNDMRKFRHDYLNVLLSMSIYIDSNDIEGLKKYFYDEIYPMDKIIISNNDKLGLLKSINIVELKGLLASKIIRAQELGISINIDIESTIDKIEMYIIDLIRVVGSLVDNAIEAAVDSEGKKMEIGFLEKNEGIMIIIINTYPDNIPDIHFMLQDGFSTKGNNRGLGLSNSKKIINTYKNATLDLYVKEDYFIQCINILNKK